MLACRNCRIPLHAETGCSICLPVKKHLVQVEESEEEKPSLSEVGAAIVADLQYARRVAARIMRNEDAENSDRLAATARILKIGNTAAKVLESARKLQTDGLQAVRNMSFIERAKLFVQWYVELAPPYRAQLRAKMDAFESNANRALEETTTSAD